MRTPELLAQDALNAYEESLQRLKSIQDRAERLQLLLSATDTLDELPLCDVLELNVRTLELLFDSCSDWVLRRFRIAGGREAAFTFFEGTVRGDNLEHLGLKPLMYDGFPVRGPVGINEIRQLVQNQVVPVGSVQEVTTVKEVVDCILHGEAVLLVDGESSGLALNLRGLPERAVSEPEVEPVVRGPREGFVENIRTNTALLRRRLRTPQLKLENRRIGRLSRTDVTVAYVQHLAPRDLVEEVKRRLDRIDIDGIIDSGYIEEFLEDDPYSPFPQMLVTERPDSVAACLLEGRVAVFVDGSPGVVVVPITLWGLMEAAEDWYTRFHIAVFLRGLRLILACIALLGPALYVAALTFHQEMLPTSLLLTIAATREGIPFPSLIEALIMEVLFEALREAGVRLPKVVGQAVSIVGALVIGQAAVQAGIVSAPMVIIVATTGIASFSFPRFSLAIAVRLLRFPLIFLAGTLGLYGIMIGLLLILVHLSGLRSFGVPYLAPVAPLRISDVSRVIVRTPLSWRLFRPLHLGGPNRQRQRKRMETESPPPGAGAGQQP